MTEQRTLSPRSMADLLALSLIWGASFLTIRLALDEVSVLSSVVHRVGWAAALLWIIALARGFRPPGDARTWGAFAVMGLMNNVLPFSLMAWGQLHIETGLTSILNATTAIFGVLVAAIFLADERLTLQRLIGVGIGFLGVLTLIGPEALTDFSLRSTAQLAVLAGTLCYALAGVWARKRLGHLPPIVAAAGMLTASFAMLFPVTLFVEGDIDLPSSVTGAAAIGYYAIIGTALAYLLYYRVLSTAGSGNTMLVTLLIPPVSIALGAVVLGERLPPSAFAGFALLATGLLVLNRRRAKTPSSGGAGQLSRRS